MVVEYGSFTIRMEFWLCSQEAERCPLSGAVSLCNPFDLVVADEDFHIGFNNVYDKSLANGLRKIFAK